MCNPAAKRVKCLTLCSQRFIELLTGAAPHSFGSSDARQPCCVLAGVGAGIGPRRKTELWQHARACPEKKGSPQHQLDRLCSQPMCFRIKFKSPGLLLYTNGSHRTGTENFCVSGEYTKCCNTNPFPLGRKKISWLNIYQQ